MIKNIFAVLLFLALSTGVEAQEKTMTSPDKRIEVKQVNSGFEVFHSGKLVLSVSTAPLQVGNRMEGPKRLLVSYDMLAGKRLHCENEANEYRYEIGKGGMNIVFRVFNDGVAFRYEKRGKATGRRTEFGNERKEERGEETTAFRIPEGTKRWMQQWTDAYEGFFPLSTTYKVQPVPSFSGVSKSAEGYNNRWGFPALLEPVDGTFVLLTEANIGRGQSALRIAEAWP